MFDKKKIQLETLSEYLREIRDDSLLGVEEVAAKTGIKLKFLQALENGEFRLLPPDVYVFGFLKQLSELYSADSLLLISQYKKEKNIVNQLEQKSRNEVSWKKSVFGRIAITPKFLSLVAGIAFVAVTVVYIIWQVTSINRAPSLEIFQPEDRQLVKESYVVVSGKTDPGISVTVNGQDVFVDNQGGFKIQLGVESGPKDLEITAKNKFDKAVTKKISVVGDHDAAVAQSAVELRLEFFGDVDLVFSIDDNSSEVLSFHRGDTKTFTGQKKVVISTSDAGLTNAALNGQALGLLGRAGEKLENVPFFAEDIPAKNGQE